MDNKTDNVPLNIIPNILNHALINSVFSTCNENDQIKTISLYINFPFCKTMCTFCPILKQKYDVSVTSMYLIALKKEISLYADLLKKHKIDSIHFGGGTPSLMSDIEFDNLLSHLGKYINIDKVEILLEAHPKFISSNLIDYLSTLNKCTLNFGVQNFNDTILLKIKRNYTKQDIFNKITLAKSKINKIGIDYICDWPDSNFESLKSDIKDIEKMQIDHISHYPLMPINDKQEKGKLELAEPQNLHYKIGLNQACEEALLSLGYKKYSIYHYEKNDSYSHIYGRNQICGGEWLGIGANAYTYLNSTLYINQDVDEYIRNFQPQNGRYMDDITKFAWDFGFFIRKIPLHSNELLDKFYRDFSTHYKNIMKSLMQKNYINNYDDIRLNWNGVFNLQDIVHMSLALDTRGGGIGL